MSGSAKNMEPGSCFNHPSPQTSHRPLGRLAEWLPLLAIAIPAAAMLSTAAFNILIGFTTALLLVSWIRWRLIPIQLPPIKLPLAIFLGWTLLSIALSEHPASGWPQIRKFYIFLTLPILYTCLRRTIDFRRLMLALVGAGTLSAGWSMAQFYNKYERAIELRQPFYQAYVADRITGFMSHWMTFAAEMMTAALLLAAFVFFGRHSRRFLAVGLVCAALLGLALVLGFTRSIWPATAAGAIYLLWRWDRRSLLALPVAAALVIAVAPEPVRTRILSVYKPDTRLDSNEHRSVLRRAGVRIIADYPLFGLGPEHVKGRLLEYVPPDVPIPLPNTWWYGHLHNIYLQYAAERGIPALLALLWLIGRFLYDSLRALQRAPGPPDDRGAMLQASVAVIVGILVAGWWEHNLGDSEVLTLFLTMIACGYAAAESIQTQKVADVRTAA